MTRSDPNGKQMASTHLFAKSCAARHCGSAALDGWAKWDPRGRLLRPSENSVVARGAPPPTAGGDGRLAPVGGAVGGWGAARLHSAGTIGPSTGERNDNVQAGLAARRLISVISPWP